MANNLIVFCHKFRRKLYRYIAR